MLLHGQYRKIYLARRRGNMNVAVLTALWMVVRIVFVCGAAPVHSALNPR
jgi:hypothetical protein